MARNVFTGTHDRPARLVVLPFLLLIAVLSACTTLLPRRAVPPQLIDTAAPYGIRADTGLVRQWGDQLNDATREALVSQRVKVVRQLHADKIRTGQPLVQTALALSGGGPDGAFGAGLLKGWTERGDRPEFSAVTGISTGAIIALFAYLGPDYDDELEEIYTTYTTEELLTPALFAALTGGSAVTDNSGYRALIESYINDDIVARLAAEHKRGRVLLIGTTNIDASRPVVWAVSAIAATGHPSAKELIWDIVQASSAIPAVFPPVIIPVETPDGQVYDEMHVDGGATQQVMLFNPGFSIKEIDDRAGLKAERTLYVVMNNKLDKPYEPVRARLLPIAGRAGSSLLGGSGTGDIYKLFAVGLRDGIDLSVTAIPREFDLEAESPFDPVYMKGLFELGYQIGLSGDAWSSYPPDYYAYP
ncbi:MAG: patatin-like phospholipase family protein [Pseudomonadota bacterium]